MGNIYLNNFETFCGEKMILRFLFIFRLKAIRTLLGREKCLIDKIRR